MSIVDHKSKSLLRYWSQSLPREGSDMLRAAVRDLAVEAREQLVENSSGKAVSWSGGAFKINTQTGNLRRRNDIEHPYMGDPYTFLAYNDAAYVSLIEDGITGEEKRNLILFNGREHKVSKKGRAYKRIPRSDGGFWTLTEDSQLADQSPRPFIEATAHQMRERAAAVLGQTFSDVFKGSKSGGVV